MHVPIGATKTIDYKLVHYTKEPFGFPGRFRDRGAMLPQPKPTGLWISVDGYGEGWADWCRLERYRLDDLALAYEATLAADASILRLSTPDQLDEFTLQYQVEDALMRGFEIRWDAVADLYDGIIIAPYVYERRLTRHTYWYYGWDCASGCIWNRRGIAAMTLIQA